MQGTCKGSRGNRRGIGKTTRIGLTVKFLKNGLEIRRKKRVSPYNRLERVSKKEMSQKLRRGAEGNEKDRRKCQKALRGEVAEP